MKHILVLMLLFQSLVFYGQDATQFFEDGNLHYEKAEYGEAIKDYISVIELGYNSFELQYNLGNSYYQSNNLGKAILHFEKAKLLNPSHPRLIENLSIARDKIETDILEIPDFVLFRVWKKIVTALHPIVWLCLQFVLGIFLLFMVYKWKFSRESVVKLKSLTIALCSLMILLFAIVAGYQSENYKTSSDAGVILNQCYLMSGADIRSEEMTYLSSGIKFELLDEIGEWKKIKLLNKEIGWVQTGNVEMI